MSSTTDLHSFPCECPYCSGGSQHIFHGGKCPKVKEIEYYPDGVTPKKVEFFPENENNRIVSHPIS